MRYKNALRERTDYISLTTTLIFIKHLWSYLFPSDQLTVRLQAVGTSNPVRVTNTRIPGLSGGEYIVRVYHIILWSNRSKFSAEANEHMGALLISWVLTEAEVEGKFASTITTENDAQNPENMVPRGFSFVPEQDKSTAMCNSEFWGPTHLAQ